MNITMTGACLATRLLTVAVVSGVSMCAQAALSCPFADGNGAARGACIAGQGTWQTSLLPRDWDGNGVGVDAYYDPFLDITWLKDAELAQTSGHDADGRMTFSSANAWAAGLTLFGGNEWRLPTLTPVNDRAFNTAFSNNGSTDVGTARTGVGWGEDSELGYMYYVHLGNGGLWLPDDANPGSTVVQTDWGLWGLWNTGPFRNLQTDLYWTNLAFESSGTWGFVICRVPDDCLMVSRGGLLLARAWLKEFTQCA